MKTESMTLLNIRCIVRAGFHVFTEPKIKMNYDAPTLVSDQRLINDENKLEHRRSFQMRVIA